MACSSLDAHPRQAPRGLSPSVSSDKPKPGFLNREHFPSEKNALGELISDVLDLGHTSVPPKFSRSRLRRGRGSDEIQTENPVSRSHPKAVVVVFPEFVEFP